jgi:hypothetical protein
VNTTAIIVIVLVVLVAVILGVVLGRRRRSASLQQHFGPEYERSVSASGDRRAAEAELTERRQRREEFDVRDLRPEERDRFRGSWNEIQRGFVDDPRRSLQAADLLVVEVMRTRGYPVDDDFDRRADDLSVDHPRVVQHYREARRVRDSGGEADTERQRTAVTSYRSLIDALLGDDGGRIPDDRADRDRTDSGATDAADTDGRHIAHDPEPVGGDVPRGDGSRGDGPRGDGRSPADPNGTQDPRSEERTR